MMNVRKRQFKSFEILAEEASFPIMSFWFQFWRFLMLVLKTPKCNNVNDAKDLQILYHYSGFLPET